MPHGTTAPKLRILLAEEQAAARDLVVLVLSRLRYQIERAATGARRACPGAAAVRRPGPAQRDFARHGGAGPDPRAAPPSRTRSDADRRHLPGRQFGDPAGLSGGRRGRVPHPTARDRAPAASDRAADPAPRPDARLAIRSSIWIICAALRTAILSSKGNFRRCFCPPPRCICAACTKRWPAADHGARSRMLSRGPAPISARAGCRRWHSPPNARSRAVPSSKRSSAPLMRSARSSIVTHPADGVRQQQRRSLRNSLIRTSVSPEIVAAWLWSRWPQTNRV